MPRLLISSFFALLILAAALSDTYAQEIVDFRQDTTVAYSFGGFLENHSFDSEGLIFDVPVFGFGAISVITTRQFRLEDIQRIGVTARVESGNQEDLFFFLDHEGSMERFVYRIPGSEFVENEFTTVYVNTTNVFGVLFTDDGILNGTLTNVGFAPSPEGDQRAHFTVQSLVFEAAPDSVLLGDVDLGGSVDLFDIAPFIGILTSNTFLEEADCNQDGEVNLFDIAPFIEILASQ